MLHSKHKDWGIEKENKDGAKANKDSYMQGDIGGGRGRQAGPIQSQFEW